MPDYQKLRQAHSSPLSIKPTEIFARLVKPDHIRDLSPAQAEVVDRWFESRESRDIILKLNTGAGKTLVGLLAARSTINEKGGPVLYLCPNRQLVEQTIAKAKEVRIDAEPYVPGQQLPWRFLSGDAILIATYAALFNGRSKFGVEGSTDYVSVQLIILDDAHVELSDLRDQFTLRFVQDDTDDRIIYDELLTVLRPYFLKTSKPGLFEDIVEGREQAVLELPYWLWFEIKDAVFKIARRSDKIQWPLIRDSFDHCHCFIEAGAISITPILPIVDLLPTFSGAPRRLFMSATLADDGVLAATFGLSREALKASIASSSLTGVSERMILVPEMHEHLTKESVHDVISSLIDKIPKTEKGVVVLTPSRSRAEKDWPGIPLMDTPQKVAEQVTRMQDGRSFGPVAFANRYDGMDLKDNACRLLIIDGLPQGRNAYETARGTALVDSAEVAAILAQRLEQGIGRAARGGADYCAVLLLRGDLISWLSNRSHWKFMTASTRAQIAIGEELTEALTDAADFEKTILQCVNHDDDWVTYHAGTLPDKVAAQKDPASSNSPMIVERRAFEEARHGDPHRAIDILAEAASTEASISKEYKGWFLQLAARYTWYIGDKAQAIKYQQTAFSLNRRLLKPPVTLPYEPMAGPATDQADTILASFGDFNRGKGYIAKVEVALTSLSRTSSPNQFEEALSNLGRALGFACERPDHEQGIGPDVLWLTHERTAFVIEAKSDKHVGSALNKAEKGQLLSSCEWFKENYENWSFTGLVVLPEAIATAAAAPGPGLALTFDGLNRLRSSLVSALQEIHELPRSSPSRVLDTAKILRAHKLTPSELSQYLEKFAIVEDRSGEAVRLPLERG